MQSYCRIISLLFSLCFIVGSSSIFGQNGSQAEANQPATFQSFQGGEKLSEQAVQANVKGFTFDQIIEQKTQPTKPTNWRTNLKETMLEIGLFSLGIWLFTFILYLIFMSGPAGPFFLFLTIYALPLLAVAVFALMIAILLPAKRKHKRHFLFWTW